MVPIFTPVNPFVGDTEKYQSAVLYHQLYLLFMSIPVGVPILPLSSTPLIRIVIVTVRPCCPAIAPGDISIYSINCCLRQVLRHLLIFRPPTTPPPASAAVPENVTEAPTATEDPLEGEVIDEVGNVASVDFNAEARPIAMFRAVRPYLQISSLLPAASPG